MRPVDLQAKDVTGRCTGGSRPWIVRPWIAIDPRPRRSLGPALACALPLLAACLAGCSAKGPGSVPEEGEPTSSAASAIYGGVADSTGATNDAVVALRVDDATSTFLLCSGALVAPNVVLTARHCVSAQPQSAITCDQNGVSKSPPDFGADVAPSIIHVFTGPQAALGGTPAANGAALVHPAGTTLCNLDVALVILDRPVSGITPLPVRLSGGVTAGATVRAVGYGQNDQNAPLGTRFRKDGVSILAVGSTVSASMTPLGSNEFEVGESMCEGDSGGPAIDEVDGDVVGVVSRGGACTDATGHIYTAISGFAPLFQQALAMASAMPTSAPDAGATGATGTTDGGAGVSPGPTASPGSSPPNGSTPTGNPTGSTGSLNLRAGQGQSCAVAGVPAPSPLSPAGALALLSLLALAGARRRLPAAAVGALSSRPWAMRSLRRSDASANVTWPASRHRSSGRTASNAPRSSAT